MECLDRSIYEHSSSDWRAFFSSKGDREDGSGLVEEGKMVDSVECLRCPMPSKKSNGGSKGNKD
ncbi:hypothetical protein HPP92_006971 [Vanilla planifolia]|uniref:Uncharacterized protein n=1 Tax=Vanilla planifolia TaxID=51239 RepID=A0A835RHB1_VANPL|nr:hypothetical protein HPP92_006971 [Vanilla planifolia]